MFPPPVASSLARPCLWLATVIRGLANHWESTGRVQEVCNVEGVPSRGHLSAFSRKPHVTGVPRNLGSAGLVFFPYYLKLQR